MQSGSQALPLPSVPAAGPPVPRELDYAELASTLAAAPVGLAVFDGEGRYLRVNDEMCHINGVPPDQHVGHRVQEVVPGIGHRVLGLIQRVLATGETLRDLEFSGETRREPGVLRHWLSGLFPVRDASNDVVAVGCWVTEITERKRAEAALQASRLQLEMSVQAAGLVLATIDYRTNQNQLSAELARLMELGDGPMVVPRQAIFERIHPDDRQRYLEAIARTVDPRGSGHLAIDVRALLPSGTVRWLHILLQVTFSPIDGELRPDKGYCAARDTTTEHVAQLRLKAAQQLAEAVIEGAGALVYAKDLDGRYILSNQAWRERLGLTPEQAQGLTDEAIFGPPVAARLRAHDREVLRTEQRLQLEERVSFGGRQHVYRSSKFPLYDDSGRPYAVCGVSTDISDVVEADRRKDEFIATLAHELRNPLAPIRNGLEILRRTGALPPLAARTRDIMERQLTHLVRLVDDLLDVSRVSRGKVELRPQDLTLDQIVEHAVEAGQPGLEAAGHQLAVSLPDPPARVRGDLTRLSQVVGNLLHNAVKYTPPGGQIRIEGRIEGDQAVLDVADNGIGIAPDVLPHVFDLFSQVDRTLSRAQGGLGIGLWLVRQLVGLHRGRIEAFSDGPGKGSLFRVWLPVRTD